MPEPYTGSTKTEDNTVEEQPWVKSQDKQSASIFNRRRANKLARGSKKEDQWIGDHCTYRPYRGVWRWDPSENVKYRTGTKV